MINIEELRSQAALIALKVLLEKADKKEIDTLLLTADAWDIADAFITNRPPSEQEKNSLDALMKKAIADGLCSTEGAGPKSKPK